ncbi:TetR/AcrR family transcriptional regulator [Acuticoccus sp. M5D2P5]|uniref:TetR/AcrR family transcriptional regulator n=1 Tax=Acuticoccus kalidii TaxID=2910977 RepID=UPI001F368CD5|nr:TetR/AcrR family transcriptional regulator [Acuticoccus kalidii]MCF3935229.1 TetR/AcrR family transcriptional regulator [Acuticoccus kalidii]
MRDSIKQVATRLFILHGYRGMRFGDIAETLGTTRANIHYHYGTKENLVDELIEDYINDTLAQLEQVWTNDSLTFREKTIETKNFNFRRYSSFNEDEKGRQWSMISRARLESEILTDRSKAVLRRFTEALNRWVTDSVFAAQQRGEIDRRAPVDDIAVQLIAIIDSAGSITQDAGAFDRLEHLYMAFIRIIGNAYGVPGHQPNAMEGHPPAAPLREAETTTSAKP